MKKSLLFFMCCVMIMLGNSNEGEAMGNNTLQIFRREKSSLFFKRAYQLTTNTTSFLDEKRSDITGLVESYHGSSTFYYDCASEEYYPDKIGILDYQAFTYDLSLVCMVYCLDNQFEKASQILDVLQTNFAIEKNGYKGLLNSYLITDFDMSTGEEGLKMGIDGDRIHVGPNMWVALAALHYDELTTTRTFLPFVLDIAHWAYDLPHFTFPDGSRGVASMGSGWGPDWSFVYSTENIIDYYAVLNWLEEVYTKDFNAQKVFRQKDFDIDKIVSEKSCIEKWLVSVAFNSEYQSFNCGYNEQGVDKTKALDTVSWGIAALTPDKLLKWGMDPFKMVEFAERNFLVRQQVDEIEIEGFDFTSVEYKDPKRTPVIWWEGTGQMILMYQVMAEFCQRQGDIVNMNKFRRKALRYLQEMDKMSAIAQLPQGVLPYTSIQPKDKEIVNTFFYGWEIPRGNEGRWVSSLASSLWRIIGMTGFNPLVREQKTVGLLREMGIELVQVLSNNAAEQAQ